METITTEKSQLSELTTLGIKFYEENLKEILEPAYIGEFVTIEPYTGRYFVGKTQLQAMLDASGEMPEGKFFIAKIGPIQVGSISHYVSKNK